MFRQLKDRYDAGARLAKELSQYKDDPEHVIILAIPRGALEIGYVLSQRLHAPLDVILSKKIGAPSNPEFAIGAVNHLGHYVLDPRYEAMARNDNSLRSYVQKEVRKIRELLVQRYREYRGPNAEPFEHAVAGKTVIIVDDGVATGRTMFSAIDLLRSAPRPAAKIVVAVPVGSEDVVQELREKADEVVCLGTPEPFLAVGRWYQKFDQVEDSEAIRLLHEANKPFHPSSPW
jgi:predicted phosphoribosyltransferase